MRSHWAIFSIVLAGAACGGAGETNEVDANGADGATPPPDGAAAQPDAAAAQPDATAAQPDAAGGPDGTVVDGGEFCAPPGDGEVVGMVAGESIAMVARSAVSSGGFADRMFLVVEEGVGECIDSPFGREPPHQYLMILFWGLTTPGVYSVSCAAGPPCVSSWLHIDVGNEIMADSGTVTLTTAGTCWQGTFDLSFTAGETLTGFFTAPRCD